MTNVIKTAMLKGISGKLFERFKMKKAQGVMEYAIGLSIFAIVCVACMTIINEKTAQKAEFIPAYMQSFERP